MKRRERLEITALGGGGVGIGRDRDGRVWMVRGALAGETCEVEMVRARAGIIEGRCVEVLAGRHPARSGEACPDQPCGGCDWAQIDPELGAPLKATVAAGAARSAPELAEALRQATVEPSPLAYRLRARLHWDPRNKTLGHRRPRSRRVTATRACRTLSPLLIEALPALRASLIHRARMPLELQWQEHPDRPEALIGLIPHGRSKPHRALPARGEIGSALHGAWVLGERKPHGWGESSLLLDGLDPAPPLRWPIGAFLQSNRHQLRWLGEKVRELAGAEGRPVWDLHSGLGFFAAYVSDQASSLDLAELNPISAEAAKHNLPGARVHVGKAVEAVDAAGNLPADAVVILDPPRSGLEKPLRRALAGWLPQRLVMLSCDPATWARDAAELLTVGYKLGHLELVDLFPSTHHVEVVSVLELD